jgi:large subunit ribosomal protein L15
VPTRLRKVRRLRGSRTHGYGQVGQHRGAGSRGGRGLAGLHKHKWTWTVKFDPEHFGRPSLKAKRSRIRGKSVNVGHLDALAEKFGEKGRLDLTALGYTKLLGMGAVSSPLKVRIGSASGMAKQKLEAAKGELLVG